MSTKSGAQSLGLCKVRTRSTDQSRPLVTDNTAISPDDVPLPLPRRSSVNCDNHAGTCPVCRRDDIHVVNSTRLLRQHGPRVNECSGSWTQPYPGTLKQASRGMVKSNACHISSALTNINQSTAAGTSTALTVEPAVTSELPFYDAILRNSLSVTLNVELNDERWNQASLSVRWGGLGVRSVVLLAQSVWGEQALGLIHIAAVTHEPRSTMFLRRSTAWQRHLCAGDPSALTI